MTPEQKFWSQVQKGDGCWLWTGSKSADPGGEYGDFYVNGRACRAHRFSWEVHFGPVPPKMLVCHHCDNPPCVRPDHLFVGTSRDNVHDALKKGRFWCGERAHRAKLTAAQVLEIRAARGHLSQRQLAARFGIDRSNVRHIWQGKTWRQL